MEKYRIIEVKEPKLTRNTNGEVGFVPDVTYDITYRIEELYVTKNKWTRQEHKEWRQKVGRFRSIKETEAMIKFHKAEKTETVVKEL
jgi:hypothetical protein